MKRRRHTPEQIVRKLREADRLRAEAPDHVWAIDFQFDQTADSHNLKLLHVVDEFTREALAIECRRRAVLLSRRGAGPDRGLAHRLQQAPAAQQVDR